MVEKRLTKWESTIPAIDLQSIHGLKKILNQSIFPWPEEAILKKIPNEEYQPGSHHSSYRPWTPFNFKKKDLESCLHKMLVSSSIYINLNGKRNVFDVRAGAQSTPTLHFITQQ
jgi:hypothetical protein